MNKKTRIELSISFKIILALIQILSKHFRFSKIEKENNFIWFFFLFQAKNEPFFYFIDCAFSVIVIGTLVVLVWRSLWVLFDLIIFPNDPDISGWYSVVSIHFT